MILNIFKGILHWIGSSVECCSFVGFFCLPFKSGVHFCFQVHYNSEVVKKSFVTPGGSPVFFSEHVKLPLHKTAVCNN